jgi:hypothetical protein
MSCTPNTSLFPRFKANTVALLFASATAMLITPGAVAAQDDGAAPKAAPVCLDVTRIDHTEVLNDHQILFYMYGKKTWVNNLTARCPSLTRQDGFVWSSWVPRYCDNLETIRVIRSGEVCMLGAFTPYEKPAKPS